MVSFSDEEPIGPNVIEEPADSAVLPQTHYFNGVEFAEFPPKPLVFYVFDYALKQWIDPRSLDDVKLAQWEMIKRARATAIYTPISTSFGNFDASPSAQKSITDAVLMMQTLAAMGTPTTIDFTLADNTTATLTTAQMVQVGLLLGAQTQAAHAKGRALREQIDAATTSAAVQAINWS